MNTNAYRLLDIARTEKLLAASGSKFIPYRGHTLATQATRLIDACRAQGIEPAWFGSK